MLRYQLYAMPEPTSRIIQFLRWTERYTKTDMVYLVSGSAWSVVGTIFTTAIAAVTFLAFANWLPKENYGTYQYILSIADLFGIFVLAGIDVAVTRSTARGEEGALFDGLFTKIRWGLIGGAGAVALGTYYLANANAPLGWGFIIAGLFIPFWEAPGLFTTYLQGKKRFDLMNIGDVIMQLGMAVTLIPTLFLTHNVLIILTVYMGVTALLRAIFFWYVIKRFPPNNVHDPEMIPYGKHLSVISVITTIASKVDTILLWHFLGPVSVAAYTFSQSIPGRANGFLKIVNRIAFPKMAAQGAEQLKNTLIHKVFLMVGVSTLCSLAYAVAAPVIFHVFLPQYIEAIPYTMAAAALIALQPFSLISSSFSAQAKKKSLYIWSIAAPIVRILFFLTLIPPFGLWGAIIGLISAKGFESALLVLLFNRY
jgi:O-antigen/teichoic acid export membrane protein